MSPRSISFKFNKAKAVEAILYLARNTPDLTFHSLCKLIYFADKTSLERYGRFICGDTYYAMQYGPVPTNTYDLLKEAPSSGGFGFRTENGRHVVPLRSPDLDLLSDSDIECLDVSIALYGHTPFWKKTQDSHDMAWEEAWNNRGSSSSAEMSIESIVRLLEDSDELLEHLTTQYDD